MKKNLKGFFFVLISFILLSYILLSTSMWVRAIETSERTYSEAFRASSLTMLAEQVSEERMDMYADIVFHYSLYKLSNHSIGNELRAGEGDRELEHIKAAYFELLSNCSSSPEHFADATKPPASYSPDESQTYCFAGFLSRLNESLSKAGFEVESFSVSNFSFNETEHPLRFAVNLTMNLSIRDLQTQTSLHRTYHFNKIVDAEGMVDPLLARESIRNLKGEGPRENLTIYKGIYLYPYPETGEEEEVALEDYQNAHEELYPAILGRGSAGQGWFYGPVVLAEDADEKGIQAQRMHYILVGNYSDIRSVDNWEEFGAYIQTDKPERGQTGCGTEESNTFNAINNYKDAEGRCHVEIQDQTTKPFMVYADEEEFMEDIYSKAEESYSEPGSSGRQARILFVAKYSATEVLDDPEDADDEKNQDVLVYDIENLRDYVRCSYYIVNTEAPSFLQRMLEGGYGEGRKSDRGIETTLVGQYAGGTYNPELDGRSRVDREFFMDVSGEKVRGMPGCKDQPMCVDERSEVGHFALSMESMRFYFGIGEEEDEENIGCNDERASCEEP